MYDIALFSSRKGRNIFDSFSKGGQVLFDNEISVSLRDNNLDQRRDDESADGKGHDQREASRNQSSEGSEIDVGDGSSIKYLGPLVNGLVREHLDEVVSYLNGRLVSGSRAQLGQHG